MTEEQKQAILGTKIGSIEWTMTDVIDEFHLHFKRMPTDEELQHLQSISWHVIEDVCRQTSKEVICDILLTSELSE